MAAFLSSVWVFFMICIRFSFNIIVFALDDCNLTAPQFILVELMEQTSGNVIFASEVNFQLTEITPSSSGQFSVIVISPLNQK